MEKTRTPSATTISRAIRPTVKYSFLAMDTLENHLETDLFISKVLAGCKDIQFTELALTRKTPCISQPGSFPRPTKKGPVCPGQTGSRSYILIRLKISLISG